MAVEIYAVSIKAFFCRMKRNISPLEYIKLTTSLSEYFLLFFSVIAVINVAKHVQFGVQMDYDHTFVLHV